MNKYLEYERAARDKGTRNEGNGRRILRESGMNRKESLHEESLRGGGIRPGLVKGALSMGVPEGHERRAWEVAESIFLPGIARCRVTSYSVGNSSNRLHSIVTGVCSLRHVSFNFPFIIVP